MHSFLKGIKQHKTVRALLHKAERFRSLHIIVNLISHPMFRATYRNYLFRKPEMLNTLVAYGALTRNLYIEGTNVCNADCVFCGYGQMKRPKLTMSMEFFKDVIEQYVALGGRAVGFTPIVGDPLIDRFLFERLDYLEGTPQIQNVGFYTNGIGLIPPKVDRLLSYKRLTINLNISFGGFDAPTFKSVMGVDQFDRVEPNVLYLLDVLEQKPHPNLHVKIDYRCPQTHEGQLNRLGERIKDCVAKGLIRHDTLNGVFDSFGGLISDANLASAGLRRNMAVPKTGPCEILFTKPIVLADGRVNACAERDLEATLIIGDLKKESLREILSGPRRQALIQGFYQNQLSKVCQGCTVYQSIYNPRAKVWSKGLNWAPQ